MRGKRSVDALILTVGPTLQKEKLIFTRNPILHVMFLFVSKT